MNHKNLLLILIIFFLCGCIKSKYDLVPDNEAIQIPGVEGKWASKNDLKKGGKIQLDKTAEIRLLKNNIYECKGIKVKVKKLYGDIYLLKNIDEANPNNFIYVLQRITQNTMDTIDIYDPDNPYASLRRLYKLLEKNKMDKSVVTLDYNGIKLMHKSKDEQMKFFIFLAKNIDHFPVNTPGVRLEEKKKKK